MTNPYKSVSNKTLEPNYTILNKQHVKRDRMISTIHIPAHSVTVSKLVDMDKVQQVWRDAVQVFIPKPMNLFDVINMHLRKIHESYVNNMDDVPNYLSTQLAGRPIAWAIERKGSKMLVSFQVRYHQESIDTNENDTENGEDKGYSKEYKSMLRLGFKKDRLYNKIVPKLYVRKEEAKIAREISLEELRDEEEGRSKKRKKPCKKLAEDEYTND